MDGKVPQVGLSLTVALQDYPSWLADECRTWVRAQEAGGARFTGGTAAIRHWLDARQRAGGM